MDYDRWPTLRHMDDAGALDLHQTEGVAITIITAIFSHLTADAHRNRGPRDRGHSFTLGVIGRLRGHVEELHDRGPIEPQSRRNRTAIAARSNRDRGAFAVESTSRVPDSIFVRICSEIDTQSMHDQATIVVDPGEKRGPEEAEIMAKLRPIRGQSRSCDVAPRNRSHYLSNRLHDRLQLATIFGPISSLKPLYFFFVLKLLIDS